jgi:hypothetical protein
VFNIGKVLYNGIVEISVGVKFDKEFIEGITIDFLDLNREEEV